MFKIILADDEPIIIKGLRKIIQWDRLNAEIVAEASNGEELMEMIKKYSPDIVISDVSMPRMSGLDVIQKVREADIRLRFIFLSGYQEFDYVRKAIRYEAQEYLLKPVGKEELEQAVLKAEQSLKENSPMEYWEEEKNEMESVFRKINSESEYMDLYKHFQEMGIEIEGMVFTGVCFSLPAEFYKKIPDQNMQELLRFSIFKKIQEYVKKQKNGFVIKREENSSNLILLSPEKGHEKTVLSQINTIREHISREYKVQIVTGLGKTVKHIRDLKYAYKTAKFCSELYYFTREDFIRYADISRDFHSSFEDYSNKYKELVGSLLSGDGSWKERLSEALKIIENLHYGNRYAAENRCMVMLMDLYNELENYHMFVPEKRQEYERAMNLLHRQTSYEALKKYVRYFLQEFLEKNASQDSRTDKSTIYQVKEYIQEHYAEDLTLGTMAEIAYMNPYYFSSFFKKETGQNFKSYLTEVRMKEAVRLLMSEDMKTYELARAVGYNDVRSFTDKFKEHFGESPSGYKKARRS